jgi:phage shock protein PspC (stress-responsive transcriptional regulator)
MAEQSIPGEKPRKRFCRISSNKMIGGVCAGISDYFGIDVNLVRVVWIASVLLGGLPILLYIFSWIILPEDKASGSVSPPPAAAKSNTNVVLGAILIVVGFLLINHGWDHRFSGFHFPDFGRAFDFDFGVSVAVALIAAGVYYLFEMRRKGRDSTSVTSTGEKTMEKRLTRSKSERMVAGVCGGLAEYFNVDPSFVRIGFAIGTLITHFLGVIAYIVMAIVVPEASGTAVESKAPNKSQDVI